MRWLLSRIPQMEPARYDAIIERLEPRGFPLERVRLPPQPAS